MVVSQEITASQVGAQILQAGGNAVDAAVATGFALAVTLPQAGNIGGGGFMLVYLAEEDKVISIDYREMAPAGAHRNLFLNADGDVDNEKAQASVHSAGVPGTVAGLIHALNKYGTMPLSEVLQPAIDIAKHGHIVTPALAQSLVERTSYAPLDNTAREYFYHNDELLKVGHLWLQPDLEKTLSNIAKQGNSGFYQGDTAKTLIDFIQSRGA